VEKSKIKSKGEGEMKTGCGKTVKLFSYYIRGPDRKGRLKGEIEEVKLKKKSYIY